MTIPVLAGLDEIADRYDGFIIDLWGVLHDGVRPFPGVVACLEALRQRHKPVVLLSNAPRRVSRLQQHLAGLGISDSLYRAILSSGEAVHRALRDGLDPWYAACGRHCLQIGTIPAEPLLEGLDKQLVDVEQADFVLNTGPVSADETFSEYQPILDAAAARQLPMICANPDLVVIVDGREELCAGGLADYYAKRGQTVRYLGKPFPEVYAQCRALLGVPQPDRILAIGDSFHTDMQGAANAGLDALFISGGVHAAELGVRDGQTPDPLRISALAARFGLAPIAAMGGLVWSG